MSSGAIGETSVKIWISAVAGATALMAASAVAAQTPPTAQGGAPAPILAAAPQWGAFARDSQRVYLVDTSAITRLGDVATTHIARVRRDAPAGDYSHVVDVFEIQCEAKQSRMMSSRDVEQDGETGEDYPADEPWTAIRDGAFDSQIREISCGDKVPAGASFDTVKAYIEAGRP